MHKLQSLIRATNLLLILTIFFIINSCINGYTAWDKNKVIKGAHFSKIRYAVRDSDTLSVIGYLDKAMEIDGYPCATGWVHFNKDYGLKLFRLNRSMNIDNVHFSKNTWIRFRDEDHSIICVFPEDTLVQGYLCRGGGGVKGISTSFYNSGRLHYFFTKNDVNIEGILCKGGLLNIISLNDDGTLQKCTLARDQEINGVLYKKGTHISINEDKNVVITE